MTIAYIVFKNAEKRYVRTHLNIMAHLSVPPLIPNRLRVSTENRLLWVDFVEIIWVTILSRQAAEQARSAGEGAELEAGEGDPATAEFGVSGEVMHASEGEVALETDYSNRDTAIPSQERGRGRGDSVP